MRCLPVAQLKLLEFVGDLFLCIAASNCSFRFFNLQSVLRVNRKTIILSLTIVCHFITFFQQVWRNNLEAPTKTRRKRIKPVWQVFSSYKLLQSRIRQVCTLSEFCFIPLKSNNNSLFGKFTFVSWYIFTRPLYFDPGGGGEGGTPGTSQWACAARPILQTLTLFPTKNVSFHSRFQTWPLKSISTLRSFL